MSRFRRLVWPASFTLAVLAVLIGLGTWQLQRLAWKQGVLRQIERAEAAPAVALPADPEPFEKVRAKGRIRADLSGLYGAEVRETPAGPQMGAHLIAPLERPDAPAVLVDRGWIPSPSARPITSPGDPVAV